MRVVDHGCSSHKCWDQSISHTVSGGGLLIHSDLFALIDSHLSCYRYNALICAGSPHLHSNAYQDLEAIHIATENIATSLAQSERIGMIAAGKQADLW